MMKKSSLCILGLILMMFLMGAQKPMSSQSDKMTITINGEAFEKACLPIRKGKILVPHEREGEVLLVPIEELAYAMGATHISWDSDKRELVAELPAFSDSRLYLSYLGGLLQRDNEGLFPLPERLQHVPLPPYPLKSTDSVMLHRAPIGMTFADQAYQMAYAAYDYDWLDDKLYVGEDWLNVMFLAETRVEADKLMITYPTRGVIDQWLDELQDLARPQTPEEAVALWLYGQQTRSGALQYAALSPELQQSVVAKGIGWVTGGSSPQVGKAMLTKVKQLSKDQAVVTVQLEEVYQGKVENRLEQELTLASYDRAGKNYWQIIKVDGDTAYSLL